MTVGARAESGVVLSGSDEPLTAPSPRPMLSDGGAVGLAVAVAVGCWFRPAVPMALVIAAVATALLARRPALGVPVGFLLGAALATNAHAGLAPAEAGPFRGTVTLVSDPVDTAFGVRADVRQGSRRLELRASQGAGGSLAVALAGERVAVEGRIAPPPPNAPWLVPRHVVGRLEARSVERIAGGGWAWRAANRLRRTIDRGAKVLDQPARSLFGGFVLGDDRGQPPEVVDDFRGAGLSHVLVVSGQNVAQVLAVAGPLLRRRRLTTRWLSTIGVIAAFAIVTRFEPSVLRASAMAALAATAAAAGRPQQGGRLLALAVAGLLLVDPLLVHALGFQLSVAASAGIVVLAGPVAGILWGPEPLRAGLAVTIAAQAGVAPLLVPRFGGLPVVSLPANVLAVPVSGLVTAWGLPAGLVAGWAGPGVARWLHLPTAVLIGWVAGVAQVAARLPLGELGLWSIVALALLGMVAAQGARTQRRHLGHSAAVGVVAVLVAPAWTLAHPPVTSRVPGGQVWRAGGGTVLVIADVDSARSIEDLLEGLRRAGVRHLDRVVRADGEPSGHALRAALSHRYRVGGWIDRTDLAGRRADGPPGAMFASGLRIGGLTIFVGASGAVEVELRPSMALLRSDAAAGRVRRWPSLPRPPPPSECPGYLGPAPTLAWSRPSAHGIGLSPRWNRAAVPWRSSPTGPTWFQRWSVGRRRRWSSSLLRPLTNPSIRLRLVGLGWS